MKDYYILLKQSTILLETISKRSGKVVPTIWTSSFNPTINSEITTDPITNMQSQNKKFKNYNLK